MKIHRIEPETVIQKDAPSGKNMIHGQTHDPVVAGDDVGTVGAPISSPLCGFRAWPFMTRTLPKMPVRFPLTGSINRFCQSCMADSSPRLCCTTSCSAFHRAAALSSRSTLSLGNLRCSTANFSFTTRLDN